MRNAHISKVELERILAAQRAAFQAEGTPSAAVRRNRIDRLCLAVLESADELALALQKDYGRRPVAASKSYEALAWLGDASSTREQLEGWMEPVDVSTKRIPGFVQQKPKGVVGIVTAWNFPVQLCVSPAVAALAAGNRVMMKFTDVQQATGQVFADAIAKHFAEDEIAVITGDLETAKAFSTLQLDHMMFTGSPAVGRIVAMEAAQQQQENMVSDLQEKYNHSLQQVSATRLEHKSELHDLQVSFARRCVVKCIVKCVVTCITWCRRSCMRPEANSECFASMPCAV